MVHATSPSNGEHAQWTVFAAKPWQWKELDGHWMSVALAKDQLFAIDAAHRLFTRRLPGTWSQTRAHSTA